MSSLHIPLRHGALLAAGIALAAGVAADVAFIPVLTPALAWLLLGAPLTEELVFRLGLQHTLLRTLQPRWPRHHAVLANVLTALAFAAAHALVRPGWLAAATVLPALAIGVLYGRTGRLWPCVLAHALFNLIGLAWFGLAPTP